MIHSDFNIASEYNLNKSSSFMVELNPLSPPALERKLGHRTTHTPSRPVYVFVLNVGPENI